jgi:hypothetical protein
MMSRALQERRLREDLRALRHLPPGTNLPQPTHHLEQQLLTDLLRLSDEVDPIRWLQEERGLETARITLREKLRQIKIIVVGLRRARQAGSPILQNVEIMLGNLMRLPEDAEPFVQLEQETDASPEVLHSVLHGLRTARGVPEGMLLPGLALAGQDQLLADLLALPDAVDPLRWLLTEHPDRTARITLSHLLAQCRPARTLQIGSNLRRQRVQEVLRDSETVRVIIEQLVFGRDGFQLAADIYLSTRGLAPSAAEEEAINLVWPGFDRVVDDLGHHYLVQSPEWQTGTYRPWWRREQLRMVFYPAVAAAATELTFTARPMTLAVTNWPVPGHGFALPDCDAGELVWRVRVPARDRPAWRSVWPW